MSVSEMDQRPGVSRREALKRGAVLGGTLLWVAPAVQTIGMSRAFAQQPSPGGEEDVGPSFIGMNVDCGRGRNAVAYSIKYEGCTAPDDCFESDPGATPGCEGFTLDGRATDGDDLGFIVEGPDPETGCVTITAPTGCVVTQSVIKKGQTCCPGPRGGGTQVYCPC